MFSLLAHLSRIDVTVGQQVARGGVLGASGATGRVTGPHLHWALRLSEFSVDPLSVVAALSDLKE
jgi:murein DD-endopeptidase MepM/ murein hydrolase activator NlpD